jgi:hypothetical protein
MYSRVSLTQDRDVWGQITLSWGRASLQAIAACGAHEMPGAPPPPQL